MIFLIDNCVTHFMEITFFNLDDASRALKSCLSTGNTNFMMGTYMFDLFKNKMTHMPKSLLGPEINDFMIKYAGSHYIRTEKIDPEEMIPFSKLSYEQIGELYGER